MARHATQDRKANPIASATISTYHTSPVHAFARISGLPLPHPARHALPAVPRKERGQTCIARAHPCLGIWAARARHSFCTSPLASSDNTQRSEEHTSELQSPCNLVCRL